MWVIWRGFGGVRKSMGSSAKSMSRLRMSLPRRRQDNVKPRHERLSETACVIRSLWHGYVQFAQLACAKRTADRAERLCTDFGLNGGAQQGCANNNVTIDR